MGADKYKKNGVSREGVEIIIYIVIAFGVNYLIGLPLLLNHCVEPELFVGMMVLLPANGVFLAKKYGKESNNNYRNIHKIMLAMLFISFAIIVLRVFGILSYEIAYKVAVVLSIVGSIGIIASAWLNKDGKGLFYNFELIHKDIFILILLLIVKGILLVITSHNNAQGGFGVIFGVVGIPFTFLLNATAYFGEEYGWRGFLQEKMQIRFGKRAGIILLGIVWELWHMPLWFTEYKLDWWQMPFRFILTISFAIFLGYLYMKTKNVWICTLAHCINNTIAGTIDNTLSTSHINIMAYMIAMMMFSLIMFLYIFKSEYNAKKQNVHQINNLS